MQESIAMTDERLREECRKLFPKADEIKISRLTEESSFLMIGYNRNTSDNDTIYVDENGNQAPHWDYVHWEVVASTPFDSDLNTLLDAARRYAMAPSRPGIEFSLPQVQKRSRRPRMLLPE